MKEWQLVNFDLLVDCISNDFTKLYERTMKEHENIYGVALILDDDALTAYMSVSTTESLTNIHKGSKWLPYEWAIGNDDGDVEKGMGYFIDKHIDYYDEFIAPKFEAGDYDYSDDLNDNLEMFNKCMKSAKERLVAKLGEQIKDIIFLLCIPGEDELIIESAKMINSNSDNLKELIIFYL